MQASYLLRYIHAFLFIWSLQAEPYFNAVPIEAFSKQLIPCISITIEDKKFLCAFDSGSIGQLFLVPELIQEIQDKTFCSYSTLIGIRGNEYTLPMYSVPKAKVGNTELQFLSLREESKKFLADALLDSNSNVYDIKCGRIGWELYKSHNLLIDIPHARIGMCDSIETLGMQGYPIENYIQTPLIPNLPLLCIQISIKNRILTCVLDTGATLNILKLEGFDEQTVTLKSAKIGNVELEPLSFCAFPIRLSPEIDAILGMDFFLKHTVFIDFKRQTVYISKFHSIF